MKQENGVYSHTEFDNFKILSNCYFNLTHYSKVIRAKKEKGEKVGDAKDRIIDHPLIGKRIKRNGKEYTVENVYKFWWLGYYLHALLLTDNKSHGGMDFENISCMCEFTSKNIEENKYEIIT